jgi:hypothetical protein
MSDLLLEWMSYRVSGRRDDLPHDLLDGDPPYRMLADFASLGHADLEPDGTWRIAPPVLAATGEDPSGAHAVLCGARTPKVLERFRGSCSFAGARTIEAPQEKRPSILTVTASDQADLASIAAKTGLAFQRDAPFTLLACLPTIRNWPRKPCPMIAGRVASVKRFSRSRLTWLPSSLEEAIKAYRGLFRVQRDWDWVNVLKQGADRQAQIETYAGRLAAAEGLKVAGWEPATSSVRFPMALCPPTLITRGLVLCSGRLPVGDRSSRTLVFQSVPLRTARLALALTGLRLA